MDKAFQKFCDIMEKYHLYDDIEHLFILFSGGKDCSMMLDLLLEYNKYANFDIPYNVYAVLYPKHMYMDSGGNYLDNFTDIKEYWQDRGIAIRYEIPDNGDFDDNDRFGCKICKKSRKHLIDAFLNEYPAHTGLVTGFTMYDALSYLNMMLLKCNYDLSKIAALPDAERNETTRMLHKMSLKECFPNGKYIIRPILPFNEQEVCSYIAEHKIPHLTTPCKISKYKFKRLYSAALDLYDEFPVTYQGIESFLMRNNIQLNDSGLSFEDVSDSNYFIDC